MIHRGLLSTLTGLLSTDSEDASTRLCIVPEILIATRILLQLKASHIQPLEENNLPNATA